MQEATRLSGGAPGGSEYTLAAMSLAAAVRATEAHADLAFRFVPAMQARTAHARVKTLDRERSSRDSRLTRDRKLDPSLTFAHAAREAFG